MQVVVSRCKDNRTDDEAMRVSLKVGEISLSARPVSSIAEAMKVATSLCHHIGLGYYKLMDKVINIG